MIGRLTAAIDGEERMRQMRGAPQTGLIRSAPDCVNRLMLEQEQFDQLGRIFSLRRDNFLLQRQRACEFHSAAPARGEIQAERTHSCRSSSAPRRHVYAATK